MQVADTVGVALNTECVVFTGSEEKRGSTSSRAGGLHITLRVHVVKSIHKQQTTSIGKPQRKPRDPYCKLYRLCTSGGPTNW